jgi:hypothetical protein
MRSRNSAPIEKIAPEIVAAWADQDAGPRYKLLSQALGIFTKKDGEEEKLQLSPLFLALLDKAPNKEVFLGDYHGRFRLGSWSGSLADILVKRREVIRQLGNHPDSSVQQWVTNMEAPIAEWIEAERQGDRRNEERFE